MKVIITGARGQDGRLLRALLSARGHQVLGVVRPRADQRGAPAPGEVAIDLCDRGAVDSLFAEFRPDQTYHLAASHHSSERRGDMALEEEMVRTNFLAVETMLGALLRVCPRGRLLLAGSSQMYQRVKGERTVINETTAMAPSTFYGHTKAWARELVAHYRQHRGVFACAAILFNHESPARPIDFLSRKVSRAAAHAAVGRPIELRVRDTEIAVDWSSAKDVVNGMTLMLGEDAPADYVFASGEDRKVVELLDTAFRYVGLNWQDYTTSDSADRASQTSALVGDPARAENTLGWRREVSFEQMIHEMVDHDRADLARQLQET